MNGSNPESEGATPRKRSLTKRVFAIVLACVVVAGAAGAVIFFTNRSKPDQSRNSTASLSPSKRKVESCVTTIGVPAEEAINDLESFNESAMATVMAGFSASHGAAEYGVLQSVVSDVSQNLMSASWAVSWKSAIKHELPTIESFCESRYSPSSVTTSTVTGASTSNRGSSKTQPASGVAQAGPSNGGTGVGSTTSTISSTTSSTTTSTTTSSTTAISGGTGESTTTTTTSNDPALLQQIQKVFIAMENAEASWMGGSGTSDPVISDGQQIQELVGQLSGNYSEFYCSQLSQEVEDIINGVPSVQAQDLNPGSAAAAGMNSDFAIAGVDERQCTYTGE